MGEENITWKREVKYPGKLIDDKLTFKKHTESVWNKVRGLGSALYPLPFPWSRPAVKHKLRIIKQIILSIIM